MVMFKKILLAVDGSEESKKAIPVAIELSKCSGGEVIVLHVHQEELTTRDTVDLETNPDAELLTHAALNVITKAGVKAVSEIRAAAFEGVAKEILGCAGDHGADIIVVGSRGMGPFSELFLGSVAHKVVQLAKCPVLIAR
jgi:nucleotide-binding universal stress UspA family protein